MGERRRRRKKKRRSDRDMMSSTEPKIFTVWSPVEMSVDSCSKGLYKPNQF